MKRILWLVTTLLSLLFVLSLVMVTVLFVVPVEIDATPFKHRIFSLVEDRTGYRVTLDGDLSLRLGPRLRIRTAGLHVENLGLTRDRELLFAKRAEAEVDTLALLKGRFLPRSLVLADAEIKLIRERDGYSNWAMRHAGDSDDLQSGDLALVFDPDGLALDSTAVELSYVDRIAGTSYKGSLKRGRVEPSATGLRLDIDGNLNGSPLRLTGTTASLSQLMDLDRPVPLDLEGRLLGFDLDVKGQIANPYAAAQVDASLSLRTKTMKGLAPLVGDALAARGPLALETRIKGGAKGISIDPFELTLGAQRAIGSVKADLRGQRPRVELAGQIVELDLTPFLGWSKAKEDKDAGDDRGFSDQAFQWDWMDRADVVATIDIKDLVLPKQRVTDLKVNLRLQGRYLSIEAEGKAEGGRSAGAEVSLDAGKAPPTAALKFRGDKLLLEPLIANTRAKDLIRGEIDVDVQLNASGNSEAEMAASMTGDVLLLVEEAEADVQALDRSIGGAAALLRQMVTPQDRLAKVHCGVIAVQFGDGKAEVKGVMDTVHSFVVVHGEVDLKTEQLNLRADPEAKGVTLSLATPVVVRGSLWNPEYRVLKGELLVTLTDLAAKAALPPLILLDAFGHAAAENRCVALTAGKIPDEGLSNPVESITGETGMAVESVGEILVEGTQAVVGGIGGAVDEGGAAVLQRIGSVLSGPVGGSGDPESEAAAGKAPEAPEKPSKTSDQSVESLGKSPDNEENLFAE